MLRLAIALASIPFLLTALLAAAMDIGGRRLGSVSIETFELGLLPIILFIALVLLLIFVPLLFVVSRFVRVTAWTTTVLGLLSALLPILASGLPVLLDQRLRQGFRVEELVSHYPWLTMGAVGGFLFWLLALFRNRALENWSQGTRVE